MVSAALLIGSPPALTLAQISDAAAPGFEGLISKVGIDLTSLSEVVLTELVFTAYALVICCHDGSVQIFLPHRVVPKLMSNVTDRSSDYTDPRCYWLVV